MKVLDKSIRALGHSLVVVLNVVEYVDYQTRRKQ